MKHQDFLKAQAAETTLLGFFVSTTFSSTVSRSPEASGKTSRKWRPNHEFIFMRGAKQPSMVETD